MMGREKYEEEEKRLMIWSVNGGSDVMAWTCMATSATGSLVFIDDVTADKSSRMNSEACITLCSDSAKLLERACK